MGCGSSGVLDVVLEAWREIVQLEIVAEDDDAGF